MNYRGILNERFKERVRANSAYSLRSYVCNLGMAPSTVSQILSGKKGLPLKSAAHIAERLKLTDWQKQHICDIVLAQEAVASRANEMSRVLLVIIKRRSSFNE